MDKERYDYLKDNLHLLDVDIVNGVVKNRTRSRINKKGYLAIKLNSREYRVHQVIVVAAGFNPTGMTINHKNGDKLNNCIDNLEIVSNAENMKHAFDTGLFDNRCFKGENHPTHKLTDKDVFEIKRMLDEGYTQVEIASKFNVHQGTISRIKLNKSWVHL